MAHAAGLDRTLPNVLITGTPCTGKTRLATELITRLVDFKHIAVSEFAHSSGFVTGYDEAYDTHFLDEDRLLDALEAETAKGGRVIEYHNSELFPERWFDAVMVTRCSNTILYNRMEQRGYASESRKMRDNLECEIFGVCLEEARESYREDLVYELSNETLEDLQHNIDFIVNWINEWINKPRNTGKRAARDGQAEEFVDDNLIADNHVNASKKRARKE